MTSGEEERRSWIKEQVERSGINKIGLFPKSGRLFLEAKETYISGFAYASILCTSAAWNAFLMQKLGINPRGKDAPPLRDLLNRASKKGMIDKDLISEILWFQSRIRDEIQHPKVLLENFIGWEYVRNHNGATEFKVEDNELSEIIGKSPLDWAKEGLLLLFRLFEAFLKSIGATKG